MPCKDSLLIRAFGTRAGPFSQLPSHREGTGLRNQAPTLNCRILIRVVEHNQKCKQYSYPLNGRSKQPPIFCGYVCCAKQGLQNEAAKQEYPKQGAKQTGSKNERKRLPNSHWVAVTRPFCTLRPASGVKIPFFADSFSGLSLLQRLIVTREKPFPLQAFQKEKRHDP